ncbi:MAG TPA: hypothetical protein VEH04_03885 [Verrucomicrobiae bacterium]|nr:hypothetical protein [Verrucomicrobiae bacterium]
MTSDLSIFAARLRDFIELASREELYLLPATDPALKSHLDIEFNGMALVLFALQFANNAVYRRLCESRGITPDTVNHWSRIPSASTVAFKEFDVTSIPAAQRMSVFHSSGTTENRPSRHWHSTESLALYEASLLPWFERNVMQNVMGQGSTFKAAALTPPRALAPTSSLVHMFETVRGRLSESVTDFAFLGTVAPDGSWKLEVAATLDFLQLAIEAKQPVLLLGTAFSFVHLMDALAERDLPLALPNGSRVMETGGYKGRSRSMPKSELHGLISNRLGVAATQIVCEYGMSELSSQAYDSGELRTFRFPPWARAQVVSVETGAEVCVGETGLLRIFDLANVYSVMAIQTEDLAIRRGDGFELAGRIESSEPRGCSLMPASSF